jgi:hypothetical protein
MIPDPSRQAGPLSRPYHAAPFGHCGRVWRTADHLGAVAVDRPRHELLPHHAHRHLHMCAAHASHRRAINLQCTTAARLSLTQTQTQTCRMGWSSVAVPQKSGGSGAQGEREMKVRRVTVGVGEGRVTYYSGDF